MKTKTSERGAAMVEFIVGAIFVLVPMYLAVQALGKFADMQHATNGAARYAAWEKTVWSEDTGSRFHAHNRPNQKSTNQIHNEAMVRVFNDRRSPLRYADNDKTQTTFARGIDPLWHDTAGLAFVDTNPGARYTLTHNARTPANDWVGSVVGALGAISVPSITGTLAPPVPTNTLAVNTVRFSEVAHNSGVYQRLWSRAQGLPTDWTGLDFSGHSAILSNSWAANARSGTTAMVGDSVPTSLALGTALDVAASATMLAWDPTLAPRLDMGRIAADVVPEDRLR